LNPIRLFNRFTLDAPIVALVWSWVIAKSAGVQPHGLAMTLLGISAWLIYILDRVLESDHSMLRERHLLFKSHSKKWITAGAIVAVFSILVTLQIQWTISSLILVGVSLFGSIIYLLMSAFWDNPWPYKEWIKNALTAGVFSTACFIPSELMQIERVDPLSKLFYIIALANLVLLNLRIHETANSNRNLINLPWLGLLGIQFLFCAMLPAFPSFIWFLSACIMFTTASFFQDSQELYFLDSTLLIPPILLVFI
jgi:hypothetical protein